MANVVIIGAGIIGSSLAFHLTKRGASVTVVDRHEPATGTTATTFAYINAAQKRPRPYFDLNFAGLREHAALVDEIGHGSWRVVGGRLARHRDPAMHGDLLAKAAESAGWGYRVEVLDRAGVAELEPDLQLEESITRVPYFPDEVAVNAADLARTLLARAVEHGATVRTGTAVLGMTRTAARVSGVLLTNGDQISGDVVINCAGPDADHVAQLAGRTLPLGPVLGIITRATLNGASIARIIDANDSLIRPVEQGSNRLIIQDADGDAAIARGVPAREAAELVLGKVGALLPAQATLMLDRWNVAMRPIPADGVSSAGLVTEPQGYGEIVTHSGATLGPLLGRLIANEIETGARDPLLTAFHPDRFTT